MRRALVAAALVLAARQVPAQTPRASAVELFAHGRSLAASGKCAEAIPLFLDTLKIEPSIGALLNLAECREKLGDHAAAYASYRDAESLARDKGDDRAGLARERAEASAAFLPKLSIAAPAGVRVTVDDRAASGVVVVAPGEHVVRASAPGREPWRTTIDAEGSRTTSVVVPELRAAIVIASPPRAPHRTQRVVGAVVALAGIATVVAGGALGGAAVAKKNEAAALATGPSEAAFDGARATAASFADASTATFVAGGILAIAGAILWLTAPRVSASVTRAGGELVVRF